MADDLATSAAWAAMNGGKGWSGERRSTSQVDAMAGRTWPTPVACSKA
jgi:hypothetical protein